MKTSSQTNCTKTGRSIFRHRRYRNYAKKDIIASIERVRPLPDVYRTVYLLGPDLLSRFILGFGFPGGTSSRPKAKNLREQSRGLFFLRRSRH